MVKPNILYKCPLCEKIYDTAEKCEQHVEEHAVSDYYGIWRRVKSAMSEWFVPGGYILMNDGEYMLSGVLVTKSNDSITITSSHFPLDTVKNMPCTNLNELTDMIKECVIAKLMECRSETYAEWAERRERK